MTLGGKKKDSLSAVLYVLYISGNPAREWDQGMLLSVLCGKIGRDIVHLFKELFVRLTLNQHDLLELARPFILETCDRLTGADTRMKDGLQILPVVRFFFNPLLLPAKHHLPPVPLRPRQ